jgi:chromosome segregation ATPase
VCLLVCSSTTTRLETEMAKKVSRGARWQNAVDAARQAHDEIMSAAENLDMDSLNQASIQLSSAMQDLAAVQEEYQEWFDNMPDSLQYNSPAGEKLQAICDLEISDEVEIDPVQALIDYVTEALESVTDVLDEAEGADLPLGFGRD